ncbi:MAG: glycerol-3-phosphate acyltransferase [Oscillospiraceae bacterium]|nr:glycerol-3-phosphate acyltransferase [Oscillospiraceae bacterium]
MPVAFSVLVIVLLSYFLGCFNGAVLISSFVIRDDIRGHGSGNAGLTNFYRTYGARYALGVILLDMGKTALATVIGGYMFHCLYNDWTLGVLVAGLSCIIGHIFPAFYEFKGGKGILAGSVLVIMLDWRMALVAWCLFFLSVVLTRYVSLGSILAAASVGVTAIFLYDRPVYIILAIITAALVIWSHRSNVVRLAKGNENKFKFRKDPPKEL